MCVQHTYYCGLLVKKCTNPIYTKKLQSKSLNYLKTKDLFLKENKVLI